MKIEGKCGISAEIILDSISELGHRMTTFELVYPRFILAELDTHRMLSKNSASSRAVPVDTIFNQIETAPALPVHFGENNTGMSSNRELCGIAKESALAVWLAAAKSAVSHAKVLSAKTGINGHKQWVGRLIENFTLTKTVISGTEWENFFWLRNHPAAQPEFQELAKCMKLAMSQSTPIKLAVGTWHLPYLTIRNNKYYSGDQEIDLDTAKKVSVSCAAQVSYRKLDDSVEKALKIFNMLNIGSNESPSHSSPLEHIATPMQNSNTSFNPNTWEPGVTHVRKNGSLWSGNLQGFIQYRQLIENEAKW